MGMGIQGPGGKPTDKRFEKAKPETTQRTGGVSPAADESKKKARGIEGFAKKILSNFKRAKNKLFSKSEDISIEIGENDIFRTKSKLDSAEKGEKFAEAIKGPGVFKGIDLTGVDLERGALSKILEEMTNKAEENRGTSKFELDIVNLSENKITDEMANVIRDSIIIQSENIALKQLVLKNTFLSDEGAMAIADGLVQQKDLKVLNLTGNELSAGAAKEVIDKLVRDEGEPVDVRMTVEEKHKGEVEAYAKGRNIKLTLS